MFSSPLYLQSTFSLFFPEQFQVSSHEREIYTILKDRYFPGRILELPDADPDQPQIIFRSQHGYSQILVAPSTVTLHVAYSPDWRTQVSAAKGYVLERIALLFRILTILTKEEPLYGGSVTRVHLEAQSPDTNVAAILGQVFLTQNGGNPQHDVVIKRTTIEDDLFFNNLTVQNYRAWSQAPQPPGPLRLSTELTSERGIEILGDFNSRYAFNEDKVFNLSLESAEALVDRNLAIIADTIQLIVGGMK